MLISRSWSTFGMAGWSFCQGRIGRDCVQPFSMFSLQVSGCFRGAQKQLCNSLEDNCFLVMRWRPCLYSGAVYFSLSALCSKHKSVARVNEMHHLFFELLQHMALWLQVSSLPFKLTQNCPCKVKEGVSPQLQHSFMGIFYHHASLHLRLSEEKRTHPAELTLFILLTVRAFCNTVILWSQFF